MDYEHRQRIKIWGDAQVMEGDEALLAKLTSAGYGAKPEQVIVFSVKAWDANCPQHIPVRLDAEKVKSALDQRDRRIQELEARLVQLGQEVPGARPG
jgi:predicted pyridoxine 5'-phosphate oxidase superfamily flavin-nucleotide-binding protein